MIGGAEVAVLSNEEFDAAEGSVPSLPSPSQKSSSKGWPKVVAKAIGRKLKQDAAEEKKRNRLLELDTVSGESSGNTWLAGDAGGYVSDVDGSQEPAFHRPHSVCAFSFVFLCVIINGCLPP